MRCVVRRIVADLERHPPWVLKDPRLSLFADVWLAEVRRAAFWRAAPCCQHHCNEAHKPTQVAIDVPRSVIASASQRVERVQATNPVCIVVYRDPIENALSLMRNAKKSAARRNAAPMSLRRWLTAWHEGALAWWLCPRLFVSLCMLLNVQATMAKVCRDLPASYPPHKPDA